ncbi:MAG: hypothetical protein OQK99_04635 [Gammaproteobacteria bacterium]|nr:hypothetical protein [Gammaproteobacteria bacterium]
MPDAIWHVEASAGYTGDVEGRCRVKIVRHARSGASLEPCGRREFIRDARIAARVCI